MSGRRRLIATPGIHDRTSLRLWFPVRIWNRITGLLGAHSLLCPRRRVPLLKSRLPGVVGSAVECKDEAMDAARHWIGQLGPELKVQARLLDRLLMAVEVDSRWDWLELGCSVAEGRGDVLSDLDVGLGHVGDQPPPVEEVSDMLRHLGEVVDLSASLWNGVPRWWVQYVDGGQIDLVVLPASARTGRAPGSVALLDRTGHLSGTFTPEIWQASAEELRSWLLDGLEALSNVAKYIQRGSTLEAIEQVHRARTVVFRL